MNYSKAQLSSTEISNIFKGKIITTGVSFGGNGFNDTIKKDIFFPCSECLGVLNINIVALESKNENSGFDSISDREIFFNGQKIIFNAFTRIGDKKKSSNNLFHFRWIHLKSVKINNCNNDSITIIIPPQPLFHTISGFYFIAECLNTSMNEISYNIFLNTNSFNPDFTTQSFNEVILNPINFNHEIGFSVFGMVMNYMNGDGTEIKINNNFIGKVAGADFQNSNYFTSGVQGHYYYENGQLIGLDDDVANTSVDSTDAIAIINTYLTGNQVTFECKHETPYNLTNPVQGVTFVYTSNCDVFEYEVSQDTTICPNIPIQLSASGGTAYEWQPATGLSCTDCSNPIATLDSSQLYTVRIWNNDSCSVVRPVKINVRELPAFQSVNPVATACGTETGSVIVVANNASAKPLSYSLNGGAFETSSTFTGEFTELGAGTYTLTLQDLYGCQRDTAFSIGSNNTTQAQFTANPQSGAAPLEVSFTNTSTNASNYEWFVSTSSTTTDSTSVSQGASLSMLTFDTSGVYTVSLVAWQNSPACADTFSLQILVFDTLILQIPNVFTPNNDGANDVFSITSNLPAAYSLSLLNRWGTVVVSKKSTFTAGVPELIWDGKDATDGTYFYTLEVEWGNEVKKVEGFVVKIE